MSSSNPAKGRQDGISGRSFASADPERQREVTGYVRTGGLEGAQARPTPASFGRTGWAGVQPDAESAGFEGSSSRHWR